MPAESQGLFWFVLCLLSPAPPPFPTPLCLPKNLYPCRWHALPCLRKYQELGRQEETFLKVGGCFPQDALGCLLLLTSGGGTAQGNLLLANGKIVSNQQQRVYWQPGDSN